MSVPIWVYIALALADMAALVTLRRAAITIIVAYAAWRLI